MAVVLCSSIGAPALASTAMASGTNLYSNAGIGPQTIWSDQGNVGTLTGRVVTSANGTAGVSGAYVALVDASNAGHEYYNTSADQYGYYQITGVNATYSSVLQQGPNGQTGTDYALGRAMYKIYATKGSVGEGYSASFGIDADQNGTTTTSVVIYQPVVNTGIGPQTVWSGQSKGSVTGTVLTSANVAVGGAYIGLVNASNVGQEYFNTTSDAYGHYQITGVNATYNSVLGEGPNGQTGSDYTLGRSMYKIYAQSPVGEGYSSSFGIDTNQNGTTTTCVVIYQPVTSTGIGPKTVWSDQGRRGSLTGTVTTSANGTVGIGGAYIALVDTTNAGHEYFNTTSDQYGRYQITGVNATYSSVLGEGPNGQTGSDYMLGRTMYKIYASKSPYGEGYSDAFGIDADINGTTTTSVIIFPPVTSAGVGPQTVWSDQGKMGSVTGTVTTSVNGTVGIGGAYIALVNSSNVGQEYYNTTSDQYGRYQITGVNATYNSVLQQGPNGQTGTDYMIGRCMYKIYANKSPYGEGYSDAFGIDAVMPGTTTTSVIIFPKPAHIAVTAVNGSVVANGKDYTTLTAYMYDALGNPVADGYQVTFHLDSGKKGTGQFAEAGSSVPEGSGDMTATVVNGCATVEFGWMTKVDRHCTITASWNENPSVNGKVTIHGVRK